jgi:hypothetical protein
MFLSDDELRELTGRARIKDQIAYLKKQAIPFMPDAHGKPKVLRTYVSSRLGGNGASPTGPKLRFSHAS